MKERIKAATSLGRPGIKVRVRSTADKVGGSGDPRSGCGGGDSIISAILRQPAGEVSDCASGDWPKTFGCILLESS